MLNILLVLLLLLLLSSFSLLFPSSLCFPFVFVFVAATRVPTDATVSCDLLKKSPTRVYLYIRRNGANVDADADADVASSCWSTSMLASVAVTLDLEDSCSYDFVLTMNLKLNAN